MSKPNAIVEVEDAPLVIQQWLADNNFIPNMIILNSPNVACYFDNVIVNFIYFNNKIKRLNFSPRRSIDNFVY